MKIRKSVNALTAEDVRAHPAWKFVNDDSLGERVVEAADELPLESLTGVVVGTQVKFANDETRWATLFNVSSSEPLPTEHFLSLCVLHETKWVPLARYHDVDYSIRGPAAFASVIGLEIDDIFPISYDIRRIAVGDPGALAGQILSVPRSRLTKLELIEMAARRRA